MLTREIIESYKEKNPVKYEAKKAYFEAELAKLEEEPLKEQVEEETVVKKVKRILKGKK